MQATKRRLMSCGRLLASLCIAWKTTALRTGSRYSISYRIAEVDGGDPENVDVLKELHTLCFFNEAKQPDYENGYWWLAYADNKEPIGFAGMTPSILGFNCGYLKRAGVLPGEHRGKGLQQRLIRVRVAKAKRLGWLRLVTDCTDNPHSANNLYKAGFKMFKPTYPWAFENSLYWTKTIH